MPSGGCALGPAALRPGLPGRASRYPLQHTPGTDVFVDVRPMDSFAAADYLEAIPLRRCCVRQPPGPRERNTDCPPIGQLSHNGVLGNFEREDARFTTGRNAHPR